MTYLVLETRQSGAFVLVDSPAGPVITSATPNPFNVASTLTIVIGQEVPEGEVFLRNGSYQIAQTHSSWVAADGATTITVPVTVGGLPFSGNLVVRVTPDAMGNIDAGIAIAPPSGSAAVVIASPSFEIGSVLRGYTGNEPQNGWQMEQNDSPNTTLNPDGTFTQIIQRDFQVRVWDASDNTRGAWGSAFTAAGIIDVNGGQPLVAGEQFSVTVSKINANDVSFLRLKQDNQKWDLLISEISSDTEMQFVAPDDLPVGTFSLELLESRGAKNVRGIIEAFQVSIDDAIAATENSEVAAAASATAASDSATAAAGSASSASTSATSAGNSAVASQDARVAAETARDAAQGSAAAAATSATTANTAATEADASASASSSSATTAVTAATDALTYRDQAAASATDAEGFKDAAEAALAAINYSQVDVTLDGDFSSGSIRLVRIGSTVSVFSLTTINHSSGSQPQSSIGLIPVGFRPPALSSFSFINANTSERLQWTPRIGSDGRFSVVYTDLDTGTSVTRTGTGGWPGFTYRLA